MHLRYEAALACACALPLLHCGGDDSAASNPVTELSMVTFNAAVAVGLAEYPEQRLAALERDLPGLGADVICLQELWQPENIQRIVDSLEAEMPYSHQSVRALGDGGSLGGASCTSDEAVLLSNCLADNCAGVEGNGLPLCAVANCAPAFTEVSMGCQQCIAANQAATDVENLTTLCAATEASRVAYEDQTGLLLLSRLPLSGLDYLELESSLGDRGVLSARVETDFAGSVHVFCTHLAASLGDVPYTGPYGSWEGERLQQIEAFLQQLELTREPGSSVALLGDLNTGPETSEARAASPEGFERLVSAGFEDPYVEADGRCTFCSSNPLNGFSDAVDEGAILDHVLLSGFAEGLGRVASRVFDGAIVISDSGQDVETARSDHYGVRVTVSESAGVAAQ